MSLIDILRYKGIANSDRQELLRSLSIFSDRGIDIVHAISFAKAEAAGDRLFTFDADLNKLVGVRPNNAAG